LKTEVISGLQKTPKFVSAKFLYDKQGSELFDAICNLQEYYITRTEMSILRDNAIEIAAQIGDGVLIEFGSGSSQKVRIILDTMEQLPTYIGLDISIQHLYESCLNLAATYSNLETIAICADYTQPIDFPEIQSIKDKHKVAFFPGSSIGNLEPEETIQFLKNTAKLVGTNGSLLIGVDLKKDKSILEPAYDDFQGVSAAFALNLLTRINRELRANFNLNNFSYKAFYNPLGRIEMYIVSLTEQIINIDGLEIPFQAGELLRTEYSYKYSITEFQELAKKASFQPQYVWTDSQQLFSLHYLTNSGD
jgi:dimethylhistidine N-methyltransferase